MTVSITSGGMVMDGVGVVEWRRVAVDDGIAGSGEEVAVGMLVFDGITIGICVRSSSTCEVEVATSFVGAVSPVPCSPETTVAVDCFEVQDARKMINVKIRYDFLRNIYAPLFIT